MLGDGADWIRRYACQFLGLRGVEVVEIVDIFHAWGHLWKVAHAVFGPAAPGCGLGRAAQQRLLAAGPAPVLAALTRADAGATGGPPAEELRKALGYFTDHAARMDYPRFVARQLPIGSGGVESACKTLIQAREQAGRHALEP